MKRRTFIQSVGAAAALSWPAACARADADGGSDPQSHRILSCNIRLPLAEDDKAGHGWAQRKDFCARVIATHQPDVICLQECQAGPLTDLQRRLSGFESYGLANPGPVFHPSNAILFLADRYAMVSAGGFWLSETPHVAGSQSWDSARVRLVNWAHLKDRRDWREFRVWNTHLDHQGHVARREQARLIVEASRAYSDFPQLLAGDLNADASHPAVAVLKEGGWMDTYALVHGPEDPGFTFHAFLGPRWPEAFARREKKGRFNGKIDWIFCRGNVRAVGSEVIRDGRDGRYPSDHYFLSADVRIGSPGAAPT